MFRRTYSHNPSTDNGHMREESRYTSHASSKSNPSKRIAGGVELFSSTNLMRGKNSEGGVAVIIGHPIQEIGICD